MNPFPSTSPVPKTKSWFSPTIPKAGEDSSKPSPDTQITDSDTQITDSVTQITSWFTSIIKNNGEDSSDISPEKNKEKKEYEPLLLRTPFSRNVSYTSSGSSLSSIPTSGSEDRESSQFSAAEDEDSTNPKKIRTQQDDITHLFESGEVKKDKYSALKKSQGDTTKLEPGQGQEKKPSPRKSPRKDDLTKFGEEVDEKSISEEDEEQTKKFDSLSEKAQRVMEQRRSKRAGSGKPGESSLNVPHNNSTHSNQVNLDDQKNMASQKNLYQTGVGVGLEESQEEDDVIDLELSQTEKTSDVEDEELIKNNEFLMQNKLKKSAVMERLKVREADENSDIDPGSLFSFLSHQENESDWRRYFINGLHTVFRQRCSVGIPTLLRKPTIIALTHAIGQLSPESTRFISMGAVAYSLLLLGGGIVGDRIAEQKMRILVNTFCSEHRKANAHNIHLEEEQGIPTESELELQLLQDQERILAIFREKNDLMGNVKAIFKQFDPDIEITDEMVFELNSLNKELKNYWWPTTSSIICRVFFITALIAAAVAADQRGLLAKASLAATLWGVIEYCQQRDVAQSFLQLNEGVNKFYMNMCLVSGLAYTILQCINGTLTEYFATPGENATTSEIWRKSAIGAEFNTWTEVADIFLLAYLQSMAVGKLLTLEIKAGCPSLLNATKTLFGTHASRCALFLIDILLVSFILSFFDLDPALSLFLVAFLHSAPEGGTLGLLYGFFLGLATRADWPYSSDAQTFGIVNR